MQLLGFKDYTQQGQRLAQALELKYSEVAIHHFPDGESKVTLPEIRDDKIIFCRSLNHPNDKLIELFLAAETARQQGVKHITLVAPYFCYMRQDTAFHPGEAISQKTIGQWLGQQFDRLITVDPHLHRIDGRAQTIPNTTTTCLSTTKLMSEFLANRPNPPLLLGPNSDSEQWLMQIAEHRGLDWEIAGKQRHSDHNVEIMLPDIDFKKRIIVIVDDVVSTGHTIAKAAKALRQRGVQTVNCLITHPLFAGNAEQILCNACINHIWSTDSIHHHSNVIQLASLLAEAIKDQDLKR